MGRTKGSGKKHAEDAKEAVHGKNIEGVKSGPEYAPETPALPTEQLPKTPNVAKHRTCLYHKTDGPRVFEKDEIIPEGWQDEPYATIGGEEK